MIIGNLFLSSGKHGQLIVTQTLLPALGHAWRAMLSWLGSCAVESSLMLDMVDLLQWNAVTWHLHGQVDNTTLTDLAGVDHNIQWSSLLHANLQVYDLHGLK